MLKNKCITEINDTTRRDVKLEEKIKILHSKVTM